MCNGSSELNQLLQWSFMSSNMKLKYYFFQILVFWHLLSELYTKPSTASMSLSKPLSQVDLALCPALKKQISPVRPAEELLVSFLHVVCLLIRAVGQSTIK